MNDNSLNIQLSNVGIIGQEQALYKRMDSKLIY